MSYGWLPQDPSIVREDDWFGVPLQRDLPTRWEEFSFALGEALARPPGLAIDAGSGINPTQHILPLILAHHDWKVLAIDHQQKSAEMPSSDRVERIVADMRLMPIVGGAADAIFSISVLEHVSEQDRLEFAAEAARVVAPEALLVVTADKLKPTELAALFAADFDTGAEIPFDGEHLAPKVSFLTGVRR